MRSTVVFSFLSLFLMSCDDASESNGDNTDSNGPSSIESGVWLIEGLSIGNNTCGPVGVAHSASFSSRPRSMMLMEKQTMEIFLKLVSRVHGKLCKKNIR